MDRRYQVFLSSTYSDLHDERQAVIQALLEMDCIPAGMEMFVATDEAQWDLITEVINLSDYYILIIGARYGSVTEDQISYTEKEYDHAVKIGKPILAFVHANPDSIPQGQTDKSDQKRAKLNQFREKVMAGATTETRIVAKFQNADDLSGKVSRAMNRAIKRYPGTGWVRGDQALTLDQQREILALKARITELESEKFEAKSALVEDTADFAQGDEPVTLTAIVSDTDYPPQPPVYPKCKTTWDNIFQILAPPMIDEASESTLRERLGVHLVSSGPTKTEDREAIDRIEDPKYDVTESSWDIVLVQFSVLNLVDAGTKKRPMSDQEKYLALTQKGRRHLMKLSAVPKGEDPGQSEKPHIARG